MEDDADDDAEDDVEDDPEDDDNQAGVCQDKDNWWLIRMIGSAAACQC